MRALITFLWISCSLSAVIAQSPWVAGKEKGYAQLGFTGIGPYEGLFISGGETYTLVRDVQDMTLQVFGEYGVAEKTSILAVIPYKMLETGERTDNPTPDIGNGAIEAGQFTTLGNIQLAVRQNFLSERYVFSGQLALELPTAGFDEATGLRGGLDATSIIPSVSLGVGLDRFYGFVSAGFALRSNEYSHEFRLGGEIGVEVINRVYVIAVLDIVQTFENGDAVMDYRQLQTGLYLNNQEFFAYGIKAIVGFTDHFGINGAFYGAGSGNLVARSPSINAGVYFKW